MSDSPELAEPLTPAASPYDEQRAAPRYPFEHAQRMAPCRDGRLPKVSEFESIRCHDVSRGGVAFFLGRAPDFSHAVVCLGRAPKLEYMLIKVLGSLVVDLRLPEYLVRCQFVSKVDQEKFL